MHRQLLHKTHTCHSQTDCRQRHESAQGSSSRLPSYPSLWRPDRRQQTGTLVLHAERGKQFPPRWARTYAGSLSPPPPPPPPGKGQGLAEEGDGNPRHVNFKLVVAAFVALGIGLHFYEEAASWVEDTRDATISVIVPTLNEEKGLEACLSHLQALKPRVHEIIVADGGSTDRTAEIAKKMGVKFVSGGKGRGLQMNAGADISSGQLLCFAHADSRPPKTLATSIRNCMRDGRTVMGGFRVNISHEGRTLKWMTFHQLIKTYSAPLFFRPLSFARGLRAMFGDQTLFCRRSDFDRVGGYDGNLPIMEDLDLLMRLHQTGPEVTVDPHNSSSASQRTAQSHPAQDVGAKIETVKQLSAQDRPQNSAGKGSDSGTGLRVVSQSDVEARKNQPGDKATVSQLALPSVTDRKLASNNLSDGPAQDWMLKLGPVGMSTKEKNKLMSDQQMRESSMRSTPQSLQEILAEQSAFSRNAGEASPENRGVDHWGKTDLAHVKAQGNNQAAAHRSAAPSQSTAIQTSDFPAALRQDPGHDLEASSGGEIDGTELASASMENLRVVGKRIRPLRRSHYGWRKGARCRGRIRMIINPCTETSGRRLAEWGNLKGTWIHFRLATWWYFGGSKGRLQKLYDKLYTDKYR